MAYQPLNVEPSTPPRVKRLIRILEKQSFKDVHTMLRLPIPNYRLNTGCHFAIAHVLLAAVGGISTTLYRRGKESGEMFKGLLKDYYPWHLEPNQYVSNLKAARIIYEVFRNPLTHDLGLDLSGSSQGIKVKVKRLERVNQKGGPTDKWIERLEKDSQRQNMSPAVTVQSYKKVLLVEALYWGLRRMVEAMTQDTQLMVRAERFLANKGY